MDYSIPSPRVKIYAADRYVREKHLYQYPREYAVQTAVLGMDSSTASGSAHHHHHHQPVAGSSSQQNQLPENAIYYMGMSSGAVPGAYSHETYVNIAESSQRQSAVFPSTVYPQTIYGPSYSYNAQYGSSYLPYPQPSPPHRRSRTAPSRTLPRGYQQPQSAAVPVGNGRRPRGVSAEVDRRQYRAYIGAGKKPAHLYRKSRLSYQDPASFAPPAATVTDYPFQAMASRPTSRVVGPSVYTPSYTTYPPTKMHYSDTEYTEYRLWLRILVKLVELILGAASIGLILGPMRSTSLVDFVTRTRTEWQGVVVGIVSSVAIATLLLLITTCIGHKNNAWRRIDAHCVVVSIILYLIAACVEAYYAACYPPNGPMVNVVCHRAEWIIATILCFINVVVYVVDFILTWISGISML